MHMPMQSIRLLMHQAAIPVASGPSPAHSLCSVQLSSASGSSGVTGKTMLLLERLPYTATYMDKSAVCLAIHGPLHADCCVVGAGRLDCSRELLAPTCQIYLEAPVQQKPINFIRPHSPADSITCFQHNRVQPGLA